MSTPWKIKLAIQAPTGSRVDIAAHITEAAKDAIMAALDTDFKGEPLTSSHHLPDAKKMVPLTDEQILAFAKSAPALETAEAEWIHVARAIEAAHGIGIIPDSRIENTAPYTADAIAELEQEARLMRARMERLEGENKVMLQALKRASDLLARYPKHHDAWAESRAAIASVKEGA